MPVVQRLRIEDLHRTAGTQLRERMDAVLIAEYAELYREGGPGAMGPLEVVTDGLLYFLVDGFHRTAAAGEAGLKEILCTIREGSLRDAVLLAAGANRNHGLRRTRADLHRAIACLLNDPEWRLWSDREIADRVGCTHPTISAARERLWGVGVLRSGASAAVSPSAHPATETDVGQASEALDRIHATQAAAAWGPFNTPALPPLGAENSAGEPDAFTKDWPPTDPALSASYQSLLDRPGARESLQAQVAALPQEDETEVCPCCRRAMVTPSQAREWKAVERDAEKYRLGKVGSPGKSEAVVKDSFTTAPTAPKNVCDRCGGVEHKRLFVVGGASLCLDCKAFPPPPGLRAWEIRDYYRQEEARGRAKVTLREPEKGKKVGFSSGGRETFGGTRHETEAVA